MLYNGQKQLEMSEGTHSQDRTCFVHILSSTFHEFQKTTEMTKLSLKEAEFEWNKSSSILDIKKNVNKMRSYIQYLDRMIFDN